MNKPVFENCTGHIIRMLELEGDAVLFELQPVATSVRCAMRIEDVEPLSHNGIPVPLIESVVGEVTDLPEPREGVTLVVSTLAAGKAVAAGRTDVVSPRTDSTALRINGQVWGVRGFQRPRPE